MMFKLLKSHPTCFGINPNHYAIICCPYIIAIDRIARSVSHRLYNDKASRFQFENKAVLSVLPLYLLLQLVICEVTFLVELGWQGEKKNHGLNGIYWLLLLNVGIYAVDYVFEPTMVKKLYLYHYQPACYQFVTAAVCHASWKHLFGNLFDLYFFGKVIQEESGDFALWVWYILTGFMGNVMSWFILPENTISVGASGAVYGLFAISLFVKMHFVWTDMVVLLILAYDFQSRVRIELQYSVELLEINQRYRRPTGHIAHVSGAVTGVSLGCLRAMVPMLVLNLAIKVYYISIPQSRLATDGHLN
ncbi:rhomboid-like protein 11, chloroplastic [Papaver somniferum]|uniref:rhomboid-like protein 11, chloroplastic n=1 Tax=Papaver somniferum TaxID=3469 RepID=UPI000E7027A4|nr:rhomboid-like protein 11, chloroplastic [Papaver somniferum]